MDVRLISDDGIEDRSVGELPALLARQDGLVWVDIPGCDKDAARVLSEVFAFHPLAIKDCVERNRVPKMHAYLDHLFVVLHEPERGERGHVHYIEIDQFIGRNYLVTVHGPVNPAVDPEVALRETRAVLARIKAGRLRPDSAFELSHAIVSAVMRNQEEYVETVTSDVWRLEQRVTGGQVGEPEEFLNELFRARHGLLAVRTMAALSAAIYGGMANLTRISPGGQRLVVDIAGQFERIRSVADGEREYLQGVIEFYQTTLTIKAALIGQAQNEEVKHLTEASYTQNEEIKKISAWAAIFFAPTLVGTVYGMNFEHMPELHWALGYPLAVVAMALASGALYMMFKRRGWL
ncbi:magnesium transporter CorA family protein [Planotetraspora phitsanulokensis]|uniref:Magnesium transporter n=1 Tax=Planotetraspora phitsanulokensis TaxID=575192 RepID=A0A8J3XHK8_9ACTN|nr:magnesium transporter CorA family protein [Planotetraspora phitsanulokensis]GII42082.1 magnesium transporter [Planotetraspora phitsanulokensis]